MPFPIRKIPLKRIIILHICALARVLSIIMVSDISASGRFIGQWLPVGVFFTDGVIWQVKRHRIYLQLGDYFMDGSSEHSCPAQQRLNCSLSCKLQPKLGECYCYSSFYPSPYPLLCRQIRAQPIFQAQLYQTIIGNSMSVYCYFKLCLANVVYSLLNGAYAQLCPAQSNMFLFLPVQADFLIMWCQLELI